jgi:protein-disulfide isomerase
MWQGHQNNVRFIYKFFPLPAHVHGEPASRAGIAAWNQGKFWEMHDLLFANRDHLEGADLDSYAKQLGLDMAKFHADMQAQATTDRIERDRKLGESVGVQGTPSIFINGRDFEPRQDIEEWISFELQGAGQAGQAGATAPAPQASAAPAASSKTAATAPSAAASNGAKKK